MNGARCWKIDNTIHTAGHSDKAGVTNASVPTCGCAKRGLFVESKGIFGRSKRREGTAKWVQTLNPFGTQGLCVCSALVFLRYSEGKSARALQLKSARPIQAREWGAQKERVAQVSGRRLCAVCPS
jgi:hypothetical protein